MNIRSKVKGPGKISLNFAPTGSHEKIVQKFLCHIFAAWDGWSDIGSARATWPADQRELRIVTCFAAVVQLK